MARWLWLPVLLSACSPPPARTITVSPPPKADASLPEAALPPIVHSSDPLIEAQSYFATRPVRAIDAHTILVEGEELKLETGAWRARPYGTNYYASTFANCFLSRKAYLGAPEQSERSVASIVVDVPEAGRYLALARYEAAYRFHTQFRLQIEQKGKAKLDRLYGSRDNLRIYAFRAGLQKEVALTWGSTETIVWEGHDAYVDLEAGPARLTLLAEAQPEPAARRNVDAIVLTSAIDDVKQRIAKEAYLPLDGLLTQAGDVHLRATNRSTAPMTLTVPPGTEHSPYWVHTRTWKPMVFELSPGQSLEWTEVGSLLDTLNDGQWTISSSSKGPLLYDLEIGVANADGSIDSMRKLPAITEPKVELGYFSDTRHSRSIIPVADVLYNLVDRLKEQPVAGKPLQRTLFYAYSFDPRPTDPRYEAARSTFYELMGATALDRTDPSYLLAGGPLKRGYLDVRGIATDKLEAYGKKLQAEGKTDQVVVVSLGDEIGLATPAANDEKAFTAFLATRKVAADELDKSAGGKLAKVHYSTSEETKKTKPALYHQSKIFSFRFGIEKLAERTATLRKYFPHAGIGANFSPHHGHPYLGETHKWISLFREDGMTMPWSEDYIFMSPVGSPQVNMLGVDMFRAAIRGKPGAKIDYYVMPHAPNNTPAGWRRQLYGDIAHGVKVFDLFEFRPVQAAYTENYVNDIAMYREVRKSIHELGTFEDLVQDGAVRPAIAGLWFSEAADVWNDHEAPFDADERALYLAIRHRQIPLDVVLEGDPLKNWSVLYLTDRHVSRAASVALVQWVEAGGRLIATAGAGMFDERNQPNLVLQKLFAIKPEPLELDEPNRVTLEKQDLPFVTAMDRVKTAGGSIPVISARQRFAADPANVVATFADGSPAIAERKVKKGTVRYLGFLPGLAYLKPAIPRRPLDRSPAPDSMTHLLPTAVDPNVAPWIGFADLALPFEISAPFVEATMIDAPKGLLMALVNWSGTPAAAVKLTLAQPAPGTTATLASGAPVTASADRKTFTFDLEVADAISFR